jgi:hypothetical protein
MVPANIFDCHGTLADVSSIHHFLEGRDYEGFYAASLLCPPIESTVAEARRSRESGYVNLLFTGMPERYRDGLREWLTLHDVPIDVISMRGDKDRRKAFVLKREMYLNAVESGYYITRAWDDDPSVIDLWEALGVPAVRIPGWVENLTTRRVDKQVTAS